MFFIFGSPRSGTTLLALCLSAHPDIVVPEETDFIIPMAFTCDRIADLEKRRAILKRLIPQTERFDASLGEFLSREELEEIIDLHCDDPAHLLEAIHAAIAAKAGKKLAGNKSPNDLLFLRMLVKVAGLPRQAKIIHIIRDGRDTLSSILSAGMTDKAEIWFPNLWSASNLYLHGLYAGSEQYHLVKYEHFVHAPEQALREICSHLGVEFLPAMLDPERRDQRYRGNLRHSKVYEPISPRNIATYRSTLSDAAIAQCEVEARPALQTFGYILPTEQFATGDCHVSHS
jgi:hypothetical protein